MVTRGQYLERPTLIPLPGGLVLEGVAHRGERTPGLLVLPPPPAEGSGMDHVAAAEIAYAVSRQGHPTLRFNYRGVGASQGPIARVPEAWLEDALAAFELACDNARGEPAVVVSIGASDAVALELARRRTVAGLALVSPSVVGPDDLGGASRPLGVVVPELDSSPQLAASWTAAAGRLAIDVTIVPGATGAYARNLPMVGKAVAALIGRASRPTMRSD